MLQNLHAFRFYHSLPPITKAYGTVCLLATATYHLGLYHPAYIALFYDKVFYGFQVRIPSYQYQKNEKYAVDAFAKYCIHSPKLPFWYPYLLVFDVEIFLFIRQIEDLFVFLIGQIIRNVMEVYLVLLWTVCNITRFAAKDYPPIANQIILDFHDCLYIKSCAAYTCTFEVNFVIFMCIEWLFGLYRDALYFFIDCCRKFLSNQ